MEDRVSVQVRPPSVQGRGSSHVQRSPRAAADGGSMGLTDDEKSCMLLVMRTLSIVPLNFKVCFMSTVRNPIAEGRWLN